MPHKLLKGQTLKVTDAFLTKEGFLKFRALVTGIGVLDYTDSFGIHILRSEEEVFSEESMESLKGRPITRGHPWDNLTWETAKYNSVGYTGDGVFRDGDDLGVNGTLTDSECIRPVLVALQDNLEVLFSTGAWAKPIEAHGYHNGLAYQASMTEIRYNHLAILLDGQTPRYPNTKIVEDSKGRGKLFIMDGVLIPQSERSHKAVEITLPNGIKIQVPDSNDARQLQNFLTEHNQVKEKASEQSGTITELNRQLTQAQAAVQAQKENAEKEKRKALAEEACSFLDGKTPDELADFTEQQIHTAVLVADGYAESELAKEEPAVLRGMYKAIVGRAKNDVLDSIEEDASEGAKRRYQGGAVITDTAQDARAASIKRVEEKYKATRKGAV